MKICPRCGGEFDKLPAISRVDNKTMICGMCGSMEVIEAMEIHEITEKEALMAYRMLKKYCHTHTDCDRGLSELDEMAKYLNINDIYSFHEVAFHNVKDQILIEIEKCNHLRIKSIKEEKADSEVKMRTDMQMIYKILLERLEQLG